MTEIRRAGATRLDLLLAIATLGTVAVSALGLLAQSFWMLELLTHFRLQYLAAQLPLLLVCLWYRRWLLVSLLLPVTAINAAAVAPYWPRETSAVAGTQSVELMTVNLYGRNDEHARFIELVSRERPDVLLLLEYTSRWAASLEPLEADYPYRIADARDGSFGMALFARVPLAEASRLDLRGVPAIDASFELGVGETVRFIGVHLRPPMSAEAAGERNAQLARVGEIVKTEPGSLIVAGDFNATPYSPVLAGWLERMALKDARRGRGFGMSWPVSLPILGIPIDHVLVSEDFLVDAHYYGAAFGSDHYPVVTRLSLRDKN